MTTTSEEFSESGLPYSVKIEQTAKGARVTIHAYGKTIEEARAQAIALYLDTLGSLKESNVVIAPVEASK